MTALKILFAGTPAVAVPSLDALVLAGFEVRSVLTREDAPVGRKRVLTASPVAVRAAELGLATIKANKFDDVLVQRLAGLDVDAAAIVAYGARVPAEALSIPAHGWVNLHFSLLPAWRGAAPVQYSVLHGDDVTGASTFRLEPGLDTGPVFGTVTETVRPADTSGDLLERLARSGSLLLAQTLAGLAAGTIAAVPQRGEVTLAPKLSIDDARIDWRQPALGVQRRVNAMTPEPGAWTTLGGQRVKLGPVAAEHEVNDQLAPGAVLVRGREVLVGTGGGVVVLGLVQPNGKKMMDARDWARGASERGELVFV